MRALNGLQQPLLSPRWKKVLGDLWSNRSRTLLVILSSAGLPGLNGFVGEFTIMQGAYLANVLGWVFVLFAVPGVVLAAVYLLRMFNDAFMGDVKDPANAEMPGLNRRELAALVLLSVPIVLIGIFPNLLFAAMQNSIADVVQNLSVLVAVGQ